ncbi:hypothetical protein GUITHDRAFT_155520 [Guillardia theta CCMP2712]|uniref:Uncharacterized protein n=1 Tax=Guillardia theta (strain CCMP2712) TaxID=905079 RepID=L1IH04_GUITC|nr:hypothetical protein GUITHDRAFT_155520 [Guillardia theta CCMP2712]EKX35347.1 hypothetical protein GUITHDRAFT_155520 [Guillardia theta CCMP2712]|eukprot:XP_005822327.1 hypothetical protein GUITHDRAFT_155520 [Guillardia theta CCMP2712]
MKQRRGDILTMQELAQGLEALGVEENMGALEAELAGRRLMESREMSAYSFVCAFQWHESSAFEGGLWESAIIDARRNKRQLMTRLLRTTGIKELAPAPPPPRFHVLQSNLLARVRRRKDFSKQIRTRMLSGDRSKERSQGIQLVHGGQAYKGWEEYRRMRRSTSSSP